MFLGGSIDRMSSCCRSVSLYSGHAAVEFGGSTPSSRGASSLDVAVFGGSIPSSRDASSLAAASPLYFVMAPGQRICHAGL